MESGYFGNNKMNLKNYINKQLFYLLKNRIEGYPQFRIAITYRCNNSCAYCASAKANGEADSDMKLGDFRKLLVWLKKQNIRKILLTGGEPLIHKDISEVLDSCAELNFSTHILTNGLLITPELKKQIKNRAIWLVLNVNLDESYHALKQNIPGIEEKIAMLRYNFRKRAEDYAPLFKMAREYSVPIRFGFTVPSGHADNEYYTLKDMVTYKGQVMDFVKLSRLNLVRAHFSRPLPRCIFSEEEWEYLKKFSGVKSRCLIGASGNYISRAIVNPDLSADVCYASLSRAASILDFKELKDLNRYFKDKIDALRAKPLLDKCVHCRYYNDFSCQGGCLIYKNVS